MAMPKPTLEEVTKALQTEQLVTFVVDPDLTTQKEYRVQRFLVVNASPWFKQALNGDWSESKSQTLSFPEVDSEVMEQFLYWLVLGDITLPRHTRDNELLPVKLWIFADAHFLPKLQNRVMNHIFTTHNVSPNDSCFPQANTIAIALNETIPSSPLHKLMMRLLIQGLQWKNISATAQGSEQYLGKFTFDTMLVFEGVPRLMTEILREELLWVAKTPKPMALQDLMVTENELARSRN